MRTSAYISPLAFAALSLSVLYACETRRDVFRKGEPDASATTMPARSVYGFDTAGNTRRAKHTVVLPKRSLTEFRRLMAGFSESEGDFFDDNYVSNESSYLQVIPELAGRVGAGGVYLGVGPEQNFTYIAHSRPSDAFIIDLRRANLVLHLFYKATFDLATTRGEFIALLLGRSYDTNMSLANDAPLKRIMAHAERNLPNEKDYRTIHERIRKRIEQDYGITLSTAERQRLEQLHRVFYVHSLDTQFNASRRAFRRHPRLRELFASRDPTGAQSSFLGSEHSFRFVQRLQRTNRLVPIVGDFSGTIALQKISQLLAERQLTVSVFYVSNVEQYLFRSGKWDGWSKNLQTLPFDDRSLFIRSVMDEGRRHPQQLPGHLTATVLQRMTSFTARQHKAPYRSFWQLCTDCLPPSAALCSTLSSGAPGCSRVKAAKPNPCANMPTNMACIPGGSFIRGVNADPHRCQQPDQPPTNQKPATPAMNVWVDTFFIDRTEVTNEAYENCVDQQKCRPAGAKYPGFDRPQQPVTGVSWHDANQYCNAIGKRLPSEAEWEKAARGTLGDMFPWGIAPASCAVAVIRDLDKGRSCGVPQTGRWPEKGEVAKIGSRPAGRYGLYDMSGNAEEWVADWWSASWRVCGAACAGPNPRRPRSCPPGQLCPDQVYKVVRGGSWYWTGDHATGYHRRGHLPSNQPFHHFGFRCAADPRAPR